MKSKLVLVLLVLLVQNGFAQENRYYITYKKNSYSVSSSGVCSGGNCGLLWLHVFAPGYSGSAWDNFDASKSLQTYTLYTRPTSFRLFGRISKNCGSDDNTCGPNDHNYVDGEGTITLAISGSKKNGLCTRKLSANYSVIVDNPIVIDSVVFVNSAGAKIPWTSYACLKDGYRVRVKLKAYYNNSKGINELQIFNKSGVWQTMTGETLKSTGDTKEFTWSQLSSYVNYGQAIKFRTRKMLGDNDYSYSSSTNFLYYFPSFQMRDTISVSPPDCYGGSPIIKIPSSTSGDYVITVKGSYRGAQGYNFKTQNLTKSGIYYIITQSTQTASGTYPTFPGGYNYDVVIEHASAVGLNTPCAHSETFYIPSIAQFEASFTSYGFDDYDNTGKSVQIKKIGGNGRVNLNIAGSSTQSITIHAGSYSNTQNLTTSYLHDKKTYWKGTAYIDLPEGTYSIHASNSYCSSNTLSDIKLAQPTPITFDLLPSTISCNTACISGNKSDGTITINNLYGGMGAYTFSPEASLVNGKYVISGLSYVASGRTVTVADAYLNSTSKTTPVPQNGTPSFTIVQQKAPTLSCQSNGSVEVSNPTGGIGPYTFSRTNESSSYQSGTTIGGYSQGSQLVYIKDDKSCVASQTANIPAPPPALSISSQNEHVTPPSCYEHSDGQYQCTVSNALGVLSVIDLDARISQSQVSVSGNTITITGLGGGGPTYSMTIVDTYNGNSCSMYKTFNIPEKGQISITPTITPVSDKGTATGSITMTVSGGNPGTRIFSLYDEDFNLLDTLKRSANPSTFDTLAGSSINGGKVYYIDVTDINSCSYNKDNSGYFLAKVPEPQDKLDLTCTITDSVDCYGYSNADVILTASGGWTQQYMYSQNGKDYKAGNAFYDFSEGYHTFYVTDYYGGKDSVKVYFGQPSRLTATLDSTQNVLCHGTSTGWLRYNVSGGTFPYSFVQQQVKETTFRGSDTLLTALNLSVGQWQFTITDKFGCTTSDFKNNVIEPQKLTVPFDSVVHTLCEKENGKLFAKAAGGTYPYTFLWENLDGSFEKAESDLSGADTSKVSNLKAGSYSLVVRDLNKCSVSGILLNINPYTNPSITDALVTDVRCYGEANGNIQVIAQGGSNHPSSYTLQANGSVYNDSTVTGIFNLLPPDTYSLYVFDSKGCRSKYPYSATVHQPENALHLVVDTVLAVINKGKASGSVKSTVFGGNDGLKKINLLNSAGACIDSSLQRNEFPFLFRSLLAGNYKIMVADNKGCEFTTEVLPVIEPETALGFIVTSKQDALCKSQTGSITIQGYGGWGGYTYKRLSYNSFYNSNTFHDLYAGNYLITVQDKLGGTFTDTVIVYEPKDSLRSWVSGFRLPTCSGNGQLDISVYGGSKPYSILNETTGRTITASVPQSINYTNMNAGDYFIFVTDSNGCHFDLEAMLPDTALLKIVSLDPVYPSGVGTSDGAINATVKGGVLSYTYQWKQRFGSLLPETSSTLKNIPSGHYQLNVFESGGCSDTAYLYLPGINDMAFSIGELGNETSYMAHDGYCTLSSVFNSWQNFELITPSNSHLYFNSTDSTALFYSKSNIVFLRNLSGGDYFISGIASTGEKVYAEFKIEPYLRFHISKVDIVNVDTTGGSNGKITLVVSGGGGNNRFTWEKLATSGNNILSGEDYTESSILNNVPAGSYRITVTDKYNNSIYDTIQVQEPASPLTISITEYKNESCKTYEDAYVILKATGGWGDYQFRDDVTPYYKNGNMFYNLDVRKHDFYLTDKMGTVRSISLNITEPDYLTSKVAFVDSVNCKNRADGNISFTIKGGTAPYRFANLNIPSLWTQDTIVHNIPAGYHTYLFTDSNNCIGQDTLTILMPEPDSLLFNKIDVTHTTCSTDNGIVKIKMQGGTKPYRYEWFNANNDPIGTDTVVTGLSQSGLYTVNVYDWHNCPQHLEQRIKPSVNPVITDVDTIPVLCYGGSTGSAFITGMVPGTPYAPYHFTWSNGDTGKIAHGYNEGFHFVTISDTNHCSTVKYFGVTQPDSLWATIVDSKNAHCYGYNDAFLKAEGKGGVGGYKYYWSTGDTTNITNNLYKGSYSLSITDANGCKNDNLFTITEPDKLLVQIGDDVKMCPGNSYTLDGKAFTTHKWSTSNGVVSNERYITVKEENDYFLEVTDSIGCFALDTIKVSIGNDALKSDFLLTSQAALGDTLSIFELSNMALDSLRWNYSDTIFSQVENTTGLNYILLLKTMQNGVYNVDLYAYSGGCVSKSTKQVEIIGEQVDPGEDDNLGYQEPLIISFIVAPNPNDGNFTITVKLRKVADINLTMFAVTAGSKIDERSERGLEEYSVDYSLSQLNSGIYLLILKAENERKQIKIIIQH